MSPPQEPLDPIAVDSDDSPDDRLHRAESRCADLERRLAKSDAERARLAGKLDRLQEEFNRMESQLLTILSSRSFRYSRGLRRLWGRIKGS